MEGTEVKPEVIGESVLEGTSVKSTQEDMKKDSSPPVNGIEKARMAFVTKMVGAFTTINGDPDDLEEEKGESFTTSTPHQENGVQEEQRSLQEIELERRRIIDNQVVRRKKIDRWAFSEETVSSDDSIVSGNRFELLRQMTPPDAPPPPTPAINESMRKYEERKQEKMKGTSGSCMGDDLENCASNSDLVDCASILEQKEQLKSFWEKKMMGDQTSPTVNGVASRDLTKSSEETPQCNGSVDEPIVVSASSVDKSEPQSETPVADESPSEVPAVNGATEGPPSEEQIAPTDTLPDDKPQLHTSVTEVEVHVETVPVEVQEVYEQHEIPPSVDAEEKDSVPPAVEEELVVKSEESPLLASAEFPESEIEKPSTGEEIEATPSAEESDTIPSAPPMEEATSVEPVDAVPEERPASPPPLRVPTAPKHVMTVPTTEVPYSNFTTETKIAMEIREMREREEELIQMRERLSKLQIPVHREEAKSPSPPHSLDPSQCNGHTPTREQNPILRTVSLDSLHLVQQSTTPLFHNNRRKDITVRPLADEEGSPTYKVLSESPVEREIKRAAEREEALRKEKGIVPRLGASSPLAKSPTEKTSKSKPLSTASYSGNTQRLLATSRIQQEIQEQTQREVALRETGQIRTISEERTDAKVARLGELSPEIQQQQTTKQPKSPTPTAVSPSPEPETRTLAVVNGDAPVKVPSPTSSTSSSTSNVPPSRRIYATSSAGGRSISMQRFIASKGKEVAFVSVGQKNGGISPDKPPSSVPDFPEVPKPTSPVRMVNGTAKPIVTSKRALTAESRIQQELMEMKAREEELRQQRVRLFGKSQPDLTIITNGDEMRNGSDTVETDDNVPPTLGNKKKAEKDTILKGPRRRHTMIAEWEKIIQSAEGK